MIDSNLQTLTSYYSWMYLQICAKPNVASMQDDKCYKKPTYCNCFKYVNR